MGTPRRTPRGPAPALIGLLAAALAALLAAPSWAETPREPTTGEEGPTAAQSEPSKPNGGLSEAELIARIQQTIEQDEERLRTLEARSRQLKNKFEAASARFNALEAKRKERAPGVPGEGSEAPPAKGAKGAKASAAEDEHWREARDAFDLVIQERQAVEEQLEILERKVAKEKEALALVSGTEKPAPAEEAEAPPAAAAPSGKGARPPATLPLVPGLAAPAESAPQPSQPQPKVYDQHVADAQHALARREAEKVAVERRARLVDSLISLNEDDLTLARSALEAGRKEQGLFEGRAHALGEELAAAPAGSARRAVLERHVQQARARAAAAADEIVHKEAAVAELQSRIEELHHGRARVGSQLAKAQSAVRWARRRVEFLESPLAPHRIARWLISAAPRILVLVGALLLLYMILRRLSGRLVNSLVGRSAETSEQERLDRVETVKRAARSALAIVFVGIGILAILPEFGVDVTVLLGGAAVFSLAIAFGAQSLVKDYFYGFIILMENQYRVGNVVKIGEISGLVEDITLRKTTLRDLNGVAHFIPHGEMTSVSNLTHGWSRVVLDVGVAYKENVDRVMAVLMEVARGLHADPAFGALIVDEPEMLGVDDFADSAVVIKLMLRTRPLKQWVVKRELLRRIKNRFDELDIEIPVPHRAVYHRSVAAPVRVTVTADMGDQEEEEEARPGDDRPAAGPGPLG